MVEKSLKLKRGTEVQSPAPTKKKARTGTRKRIVDEDDEEDGAAIDTVTAELAPTQLLLVAGGTDVAANRATTLLPESGLLATPVTGDSTSLCNPLSDPLDNPLARPKNNPTVAAPARPIHNPINNPFPSPNNLPKQRMRIAKSPTKAPSTKRAPRNGTKRQPVSVEKYFVLGTHTDLHSINAVGISQHSGFSIFKQWTKSGSTLPTEIKMEHQLQYVDFNDVPKEVTTAFGKQRCLAKVSTVTPPAATDDAWCAADSILSLLHPPDHQETSEPFLLFAKFSTGEVEETKGSKAPNLRGTVESHGVRADLFGWINQAKTTTLSKLDGPHPVSVFVLALVTRTKSRNDGFYELKLNSSCVIETEAYFKKHLGPVLVKFNLDHTKTGPDIKDDSYPLMTVFDAFSNISTAADCNTYFVRATIEVVEAGCALTSPGCGQPGCSRECELTVATAEYDDIYTCPLHGAVEPVLISRPDATIIVKKENNRHGFKDEDKTVECTIAKDQELEFIGMTLDELQAEDIDVDSIRDSLIGKQFRCTLAISEYQTVALRLVHTPVVRNMT